MPPLICHATAVTIQLCSVACKLVEKSVTSLYSRLSTPVCLAAAVNDLHLFDVRTMMWTDFARDALAAPQPRYTMSLTVLNNKLVVFGGQDASGEDCPIQVVLIHCTQHCTQLILDLNLNSFYSY